MSICIDDYKADPRLILSYHVVPGRWLLQGGTVGGGGAIRWFEQEFCEAERNQAKSNGTSSFYEMDREAAAISPGAEGLVFLPYLAGERSPVWDIHAKGVYYGLDYSKTRAHMIRASLEGVAYSLKHNLDVAAQIGVFVKAMHSMGGAANSRVWTQIKSDVTGLPISVPASDTATTLGAAILAGVAVGVYPDFHTAIAKTVEIQRTHKPDLSLQLQYQRNYQIYLELYKQLKQTMSKGAYA